MELSKLSQDQLVELANNITVYLEHSRYKDTHLWINGKYSKQNFIQDLDAAEW